jgi:hypothetical protein
MENLSPSLTCLLHVRWEMENGSSFRDSLRSYLRVAGITAFDLTLRTWMVRKSHNQTTEDLYKSLSSPFRCAMLLLFERGWEGEPILDSVQELELEIRDACQSELDHFVASLPFRTMLPLLLLQFPAYMVLLLGPMFTELLRSMQ